MPGVTMVVTHPGHQKPTNTTEAMNSNLSYVSFTINVCGLRLSQYEWIQTPALQVVQRDGSHHSY
jgi:hypothetical protein